MSAVEIQQAIFKVAHSSLFRMANTRVTADAGKGFARRGHGFDVVHNVLMTFSACVFRDAQAPSFYLNWLMKVVRGERQRMKKSVISFRVVLGNESGRCMAIVTGGNGAMTGFDPAVEMVLHDVAVSAGPRIVA